MNLHSTGWSSIGADNLVRDDRDRIEGELLTHPPQSRNF
jgi:hypothetical protein